MNDDRYNGWRNRSTWLVNLWFSPKPSDLDWIKEELESALGELANSDNGNHKFFADMINLSAIDWRELRETLEEE